VIQRLAIPLLLLSAGAAGCSHTEARTYDASAPDLREMILPPLPGWAADPIAPGYFLNLDRVMQAEKLTRLEAVELQGRTRELLENPDALISESYAKALAEVRRHELPSGWKPVEFRRPGEFVLALELEGIRSAPGAARLVERLRRNPLCRGVVAYTTLPRDAAREQARSWPKGDFDAVFTRDHLVMGKDSPRASKDLRIIDPTLEHVVLVDGDASRVLQPEALRPGIRPGSGSRYAQTFYRRAFAEIEEAARTAERSSKPFDQVFRALELARSLK
jgi:hypothetical protein